MERNMEKLPAGVDEIIIVVGYMADKIKDYFKDEFLGRKIKYVEQKELLGSGQALHTCKDLLKGGFLVLMGDDLYGAEDMKKCLRHKNCLLAKNVVGKFSGGKIILDEEKKLRQIAEGEHNGGLVNTGLYVLTDKFFDYDLVKLAGRNEFGLPQTLVKMAQDYPVKIEEADFWLQISDLEELKKAEEILNLRTHN